MAESRVEIGFDGGLIISAKVADAEWDKVESALAAGRGMVSFNAEDTDHHVDVSKICYVRREAHVSRVGF
jgi:hypothetical protein